MINTKGTVRRERERVLLHIKWVCSRVASS